MADILVKYKADVSDLTAKVTVIESKIKGLESVVNSSAANTQKQLGKTEEATSDLALSMEDLAQRIGAAFIVEEVIRFGKEAYDAFAKAELGALKLKTAVSVNGGLNEDFATLIEQGKELGEGTVFSEESVQQAQTLALQFGLTTDQVKKLLPVVSDFAAGTQQQLVPAIESVLRATNGMGRELKLYGVTLDKNATKQQQLANITQQLTDKFDGQAKAIGETRLGKIEILSHKFEDFKIKIGGMVAEMGDATLAIAGFILNGFKPLDEQLETTSGLLGKTEAEIKRITTALNAATLAGLQIQFDILASKADAPVEATKRLADQIQKLKLDGFKKDIEELPDKELLDSLKKLEDQAKKTTLVLSTPTELSNASRIKAIQDEIAARAAEGRLLADQNKKEGEDAQKLADDARKAAEQRIKDMEAFRQFTLKTLLENADAESTVRKAAAAEAIKDQEELKLAFAIIDLDTLKKKKEINNEFAESSNEVDEAILNKKLEIANQEIKINKDALDKQLKDIQQHAQDQIEILSTIKDDPRTKVNEENKAQQDILTARKRSVNEQTLLLEELKNAGITTEEDYTKESDRLTQERKKIKADEDAFRLKSDLETREALIANIQAIQQAYGELSSGAMAAFSAITNAQIDAIGERQAAQNEEFDKQQEAIDKSVTNRLATEGQGERKSADLKKQRAASEKAAAEEVNRVKRKQAEIDRLLSIFRIGLSLSEAIAELNVVKIAAATLELATVIATPIPKFAKGTSYVERNGNKPGIDTIPAFVNEGERIVTTEQNAKHWDLYEAIDNKRLDQYVLKQYVTPMLIQQQKAHAKEEKKTFVENITTAMQYNGLTYHDADYIRRKGQKITNVDELAGKIVKGIAQEIVRAKLYDK